MKHFTTNPSKLKWTNFPAVKSLKISTS